MTDDELIETLLKTLDISQKEFGQKIGLNSSTISSLKTGRSKITSRTKKLISSEFNISLDWLNTGKGEMFNSDDNLYWVDRFIQILRNDNKKTEIIKQLINLDENKLDFIQNSINLVSTLEKNK